VVSPDNFDLHSLVTNSVGCLSHMLIGHVYILFGETSIQCACPSSVGLSSGSLYILGIKSLPDM
jgi:hypothetical protein